MAPKQRTLEIGGIPVRIRSTHAPFWAAAERTYAGFFADEAVPEETIEVHVGPDEGSPTLLPTTRSDEDGTVRLAHGFGRAEWNREKRHACVRQFDGDFRRASRPEYVCDTVLRTMLTERLLAREGCLIHSASLIRDGKSFLFAGPSGAGKSTLARLCAETCTILSDDVSLVRPTANGVEAFATPFLGEYAAVTANTRAPLAAICFLRQAEQAAVVPAPRRLAVRELLRCVLFASPGAVSASSTLQLVLRLVDLVPCYELHFPLDTSFWTCLDDAILSQAE